MKRAVLIAGGTVGGLGAVLSITPPQIGSGAGVGITSASAATLQQTSKSANVVTASPAASASTAATTTNTTAKKSTSKTTISSSSNSSAAKTASPTATASTAATTSNSASNVSGSFTGDVINVGYGNVQVKITVANGKITEAVALQSPSGRSQRFSDYALPNLRSQTLTAQSAAIQGVSGASYTSYGWYKSLITALQKAGMKTGV